jgi:hypothetical protein
VLQEVLGDAEDALDRDRESHPLASSAREKMEAFIPTTSPSAFTRGPPEFPGLIAASVWIIPR